MNQKKTARSWVGKWVVISDKDKKPFNHHPSVTMAIFKVLSYSKKGVNIKVTTLWDSQTFTGITKRFRIATEAEFATAMAQRISPPTSMPVDSLKRNIQPHGALRR